MSKEDIDKKDVPPPEPAADRRAEFGADEKKQRRRETETMKGKTESF